MAKNKKPTGQSSLFPTKTYTRRYIPPKGSVTVIRIPEGTSAIEREKLLKTARMMSQR